jgi:hypothetical protein
LLLLAAEDGETASAATMNKPAAALKYRLASKSIARRYGKARGRSRGVARARPDRRRASRIAAFMQQTRCAHKIAARYRLHTQSILPFAPAAFQIRHNTPEASQTCH